MYFSPYFGNASHYIAMLPISKEFNLVALLASIPILSRALSSTTTSIVEI